MANQFTKGTRKAHDESTKDRIRAELLTQRLYRFAAAKGERRKKLDMSQSQVAAAKVVIERGKPALQSVEQVIHEEPANEEQIMAQLRSLLADPGARAQIQAMLSGSPEPVEAVVPEQQSSAA